MSCAAPKIIVGGVEMSTSDFENARELLDTVSDDSGDPTADADNENIANGNNTKNTKGVQLPPDGSPPKQTTEPGPITVPADKSDEKKPAGSSGTPVPCSAWDGDYDFQLSPNFKVRDFTVNAVFKNQLIDVAGLTASERCCNLKNLAMNVAEPILAKFGQFRINSGIRNQNSVKAPNISQHVLGQAMDIQFPGWTYDKYWEYASWVRDNVPYDQFIFEHSSSTGLAWYHLSYNPAGNRPADSRSKVMTMYRNNYDPGLKKYA